MDLKNPAVWPGSEVLIAGILFPGEGVYLVCGPIRGWLQGMAPPGSVLPHY